MSDSAKGDHRSEALAWYERAIAADPDHLDSYTNAGCMLMDRDPGAAADLFRRGLARAPEDFYLNYNLGVVLERLQDLGGAQACYEQAVASGEDDSEAGMWARLNLGLLLTRRGAYRQALDHFETARRHHPDAQPVHYNLGTLLGRMEDYEGAKVCYERSLELDPNHLSSHFNLAVTLGELEDFEDSEIHYRKALALCDTDAEIHFGYAVLLHRDLDRPQEAQRHYVRASNFVQTISRHASSWHCSGRGEGTALGVA